MVSKHCYRYRNSCGSLSTVAAFCLLISCDEQRLKVRSGGHPDESDTDPEDGDEDNDGETATTFTGMDNASVDSRQSLQDRPGKARSRSGSVASAGTDDDNGSVVSLGSLAGNIWC